jgi:hypothetical protein
VQWRGRVEVQKVFDIVEVIKVIIFRQGCGGDELGRIT